METGLAEIRDAGARRRARRRSREPGAISERDLLDDYAAHLLVARAGGRAAGSRSSSTPATAWPGTPRRRSSTALGASGRAGADVLRARRHLPPPRGQPDRAGEPRRPPGSGSSPRAPTSGWPSTATPTAASSSTSAARRSSPVDADRADRRPRAGQGAGRDGDPQPDHQPRRPRARRASSAASPVRTRVGHSFIKATMAETDAVFGGEHSGHFYFRDFWRADSGMLAALHALAALAETDRPLSELLGRLRALRRSAARSTPRSPTRRPSSPRSRRRTATGDGVDRRPPRRADGDHADWWFNVRPSNTEPLLRLNVEGADEATMDPRPRRRARPDQERPA